MFNGRVVKRSWGWYWTILDRKHFKLKLLRFKKRGSLSIQYHNLRNELWLFLSGNNEGEWWNISTKEVHTYLANVPTFILEIQYGDKCDEKDIVRI